MKNRRQLVSSDEARPAKKQHGRPCDDCPFARHALSGWLGSLTKEEWLQVAHGEVQGECHVATGVQCAGMAIYRSNICKLPRDKSALVLPADRESCFATPMEFSRHHDLNRRSAG